MLSLDEIEKFYGDKERSFKRNILREYFQYRLLEMIFNSPSASKMSFLGGTALRIIHGNPRFSEDLDFDNFSLSADEFAELGPLVEKKFRAEGYEAEFRNVFKQTYRCYIKIPRVLFENGVSPLSNEKLMIQIDTQPHGFQYKRESVVLNKFGIITEIFVTPIDILLSQKIRAAMERKRPQGRDFFDIVFLLSRTKPNYDYLREKMG